MKDDQIKSFWQAPPFPHLVIDDFLSQDAYAELIKSLHQEPGKRSEFSFNTSAQKNKECFSNDGLNQHLNDLVGRLTNAEFRSELRELTGVGIIKPLTEFKNNKFRYHHSMSDGGYLGSHVDHSHLGEAPSMVHFLNCIFYAPEVWSESWGGDTLLFDEFGTNEVARVRCKPNRLLIFLHASKSFHGVSRITGSHPRKRQTIYMDYYTHRDSVGPLIAQARLNDSEYTPEFWKHGTMFVPSFRSVRHWVEYGKYLLRRQL